MDDPELEKLESWGNVTKFFHKLLEFLEKKPI